MARTPGAHGTDNRYHHGPDENDQPGGCRCRPCRDANNAAQRARRRRQAQQAWSHGQPPTLAQCSARVAELVGAGLTVVDIAAAIGCGPNTVWRIQARRGRRVSERVGRALMAVDAASAAGWVPAYRITRRAYALRRLGYTLGDQAQRLGIPVPSYYAVTRGYYQTWPAARARLVFDLYERLAFAPQPTGLKAERARLFAARRGWPSPAAWWDGERDTIDDVDAKPTEQLVDVAGRRRLDGDVVDELLVQRAYDGAAVWRDLNHAERATLLRLMDQRGWSVNRITAHLHISGATLRQYLPREDDDEAAA